MSFSKKALFAKINEKCGSHKGEDYLKNAVAIIDTSMDNTNVDDIFLEEYYKLKKEMEFGSTFFSTVVLGILVSITVFFATAVIGLFDTTSIPEDIKPYGMQIYIGILIFGFLICGFVIWNALNKRKCVLYPYLEAKMGEKIAQCSVQYVHNQNNIKQNKCILAIRKFVKHNRTLTIFTIIAATITISYILTLDLPELFPGAGKWYKLAADLSIGVIINFIFFLFQVYIPQCDAEKKAFPVIKPELIRLVEAIQELLLVLNQYFPDYRVGRFNVANSRVHYMLMHDANVRKGWTRQFDIYHDFIALVAMAERSLDKVLSSALLPNCDAELTQLLGRIKLNGFLKTVKDAAQDKFDPRCNYGDFQKYDGEFAILYEELKVYADGYQVQHLSPLTEPEIREFESRISTIQGKHKGIPHVFIDSTE